MRLDKKLLLRRNSLFAAASATLVSAKCLAVKFNIPADDIAAFAAAKSIDLSSTAEGTLLTKGAGCIEAHGISSALCTRTSGDLLASATSRPRCLQSFARSHTSSLLRH